MPLWELLKQPLVSGAEANVSGPVVEISRGTWSGGCRKGWTSWNSRERSLNLHCTPPGTFRVLSPSPGLQPGWAAFIQTLLSYRVCAPSAPIKATTIPTSVPSQPKRDICLITCPTTMAEHQCNPLHTRHMTCCVLVRHERQSQGLAGVASDPLPPGAWGQCVWWLPIPGGSL